MHLYGKKEYLFLIHQPCFLCLVLLHLWALLSLAGRIKTETEELPQSENEGKPAFISPFLTEMIIHLACLTSLSEHLSLVRHVLFLYFASAQGTGFFPSHDSRGKKNLAGNILRYPL